MDEYQATAEGSAAFSLLYERFAHAYSYPTEPLYRTLVSGEFADQLRQALPRIAAGPVLQAQCETLGAEIVDALAGRDLLLLESEYISLFEANHEIPPVHAYAHLYLGPGVNHIGLLKRLSAQYRNHGLVVGGAGGREQPDHLSVELEFFAILYGQLSRALVANQQESAANLAQAVASFHGELAWIPQFLEVLGNHPHHPLYFPLTELLAALLGLPCIA